MQIGFGGNPYVSGLQAVKFGQTQSDSEFMAEALNLFTNDAGRLAKFDPIGTNRDQYDLSPQGWQRLSNQSQLGLLNEALSTAYQQAVDQLGNEDASTGEVCQAIQTFAHLPTPAAKQRFEKYFMALFGS